MMKVYILVVYCTMYNIHAKSLVEAFKHLETGNVLIFISMTSEHFEKWRRLYKYEHLEKKGTYFSRRRTTRTLQ